MAAAMEGAGGTGGTEGTMGTAVGPPMMTMEGVATRAAVVTTVVVEEEVVGVVEVISFEAFKQAACKVLYMPLVDFNVILCKQLLSYSCSCT